MPPFLKRLAGVVAALLYLGFRIILFPFKMVTKTVAVLVSTLFGPPLYACAKYLVAAGSLVCMVLSPLVEEGMGTKIKDYLIIPDTTPRKRSDEFPANSPYAEQARGLNFKPKKAHAARPPLARVRHLAWRCRRLAFLLVTATMGFVLVFAPSGTSAVQAADSKMTAHPPAKFSLPANTTAPDKSPAFVKHAKASAAPAANPRDPKVLSDYANFLVDKLGLDEHSSWVVRTVETYFDPYTYHGDAVYPDADHPVDTQSLPSMKRANNKLVPGRGFQEVHAPGQAAIRSAAKHRADMLLNDFGEKYEPDVKGKKKTWLYDMGKLPRPQPPGPPSWFVMHWPPERAKEVAEQKERERKFFEALDRIKEQEAALAQLTQLQREGKLDGIDLSKLAPPQDDAFAPAAMKKKRDAVDGAEPRSATDAEVPQELTATSPLLQPHSSPVRLLASGRGMRKKMASNATGYAGNPDENLFLRGSASFDTSVVDLSPVLFVISTTYSRLAHNDWALVDGWARFMTNGKGQSNGAFALVSLHRARGNELETVRHQLRARGIFHHLHDDAGDTFAGSGGGASDTGALPISPDPAPVRYANALALAVAHNHAQFELGGTPARHGVNKAGQDIDKHGNVIVRNVQRRTVFALLDDDAFVANVPQLMASLKSHRLVVDGVDLGARTLRADQAKRFDKNMYLAFPSDPYSDWAFHNTTTHARLYDAECDLYGAPRTMAHMALKYRQAYNASQPSDPWGDKARFLRDYQVEFNADGTPKPVTADWHAEHVDPSLVFPTSFGGGAVFVAPHVASQMSNLSCMPRATGDAVSNGISVVGGRRPEPGWDEQLFRCARAHLPALKLHIVPSFYAPADAALYGTDAQSALTDDAGFGRQLGRMQRYTGGTRPIVMHNHRAWPGVDAGTAHRVTDVCGDDCFLQRYEFDDNWVLTNGHSLTHFPDGGGPGTNAVRVPRRELVDTANGTRAASGVLGRVARALWPHVAQRGDAYRALCAFYASERMVVEQAPRPPGAHVDLLTMDQRHQTFRLLDTSVADDGTVMQAYVRRRDHGRELFVGAAAAGGRADFDERAKHMAVPSMVRGGLDGDERDLAAEDTPPAHDEVVLLLWAPPTAPAKPSHFASSVPLVSRDETFQWHTLGGLLVSFVWTSIKVAAAGFVVYAVYTVLHASVTARHMPQAAQVARMLTPTAVAASWSAMGKTGRSTCVVICVATALAGTYFGSVTLGMTYLYGSLLVVVVVLVLLKALFAALFAAVAAVLRLCVGLAVRSGRGCGSALTALARRLRLPNLVRGVKGIATALFAIRVTRSMFRRGSGSSGTTQSNGHKHRRSNDNYGDDDVPDTENKFVPRRLAPPEDEPSSVRQQPDSTSKNKAS